MTKGKHSVLIVDRRKKIFMAQIFSIIHSISSTCYIYFLNMFKNKTKKSKKEPRKYVEWSFLWNERPLSIILKKYSRTRNEWRKRKKKSVEPEMILLYIFERWSLWIWNVFFGLFSSISRKNGIQWTILSTIQSWCLYCRKKKWKMYAYKCSTCSNVQCSRYRGGSER